MGLGLTCDWDSKWGVNSPQEHLCTYYISAVKDREKSRAQTKLLFLAIWRTMAYFSVFRSEMLKFNTKIFLSSFNDISFYLTICEVHFRECIELFNALF